jgi:hypothetical protein
MTISTIIDEAERARRTELAREVRAAFYMGISSEERTQRREALADEWARWFRQRMDSGGCVDPVVLLPDAFARLQQLAEDRAIAAVHDMKTLLREALK